MQRQRGELVPVAEVLADLGGPIQALRETPPPARRGFTVADQVNQLVGASEADPNLGFSQGFTDGNQPALFTLHGFILPCSSDSPPQKHPRHGPNRVLHPEDRPVLVSQSLRFNAQ